jgi:hypothetical protein
VSGTWGALDGKTSDPVEVHSPTTWPVEGQPDGLSRELNWYLEAFLVPGTRNPVPFTARATRAEVWR